MNPTPVLAIPLQAVGNLSYALGSWYLFEYNTKITHQHLPTHGTPMSQLTNATATFWFVFLYLQFKVVFDAVYTPRETRLLRDAAAAGCLRADGVAMFVGQAVEQLKLFTGTQQPPVQLMEDVVVGKITNS